MTREDRYVSPRLLPLGDSAWTVEFGNSIDPETHARVLGFSSALAAARLGGELCAGIHWVPAFRSVTVHYEPLDVDGEALAGRLLEIAEKARSVAASGTVWHLPVCFDAESAPDLCDVAAAKSLHPDDVVHLLTATRFDVYMIGFLPGFPYLGGLPADLEMPRLASPRTAVPARSIAIAGRSCAAYPWQSPGGWRLVGRTPVPLFNPDNERRPALLAPGDVVYWKAVGRERFDEIESACRRGEFNMGDLQVESAP